MERESKQIAFNMISQAMVFVFSALISFFVIPVVVEKISKDVYGFFGLASNIIDYAGIIALAVNGMANRYITVEYSKGNVLNANKYFTSATVVNILIAAFLCIPATFMVVFLDRLFDVPMAHITDIKALWVLCFVVYFINLIFSRYESAFFVKNRLDITAKINFLTTAIKTAVLIVLYMLFKPYVYYLGVAAFISVIYSALAKYLSSKRVAPQIKFDRKLYSFRAVKELISVGVWNSLAQLSQMLFTGLDLILANVFLSAAAMSMLSIVKTFPITLIGFIGVVVNAFAPSLIYSYAKTSKEQFISEVSFSAKICGFICSVPVIGLIVFGKSFFGLWLPTLSDAEILKIQILSILTLLPQTVSIYVFPLYQVNTITCKVKVPAIVDAIIGVINVVVVYLLLEFTNLELYAIAGVSSVLLVIKILTFVPIYAARNLQSKKRVFYPLLLRGLFNNFALIVCFGALNAFSAESWLHFILQVFLAAVVGYLISSMVVFAKDERKSAISLIKSKFKKR